MSIRDDVWKSQLGRDPSPAERKDMEILASDLLLGENDPFWGVIAFFQIRVPALTAELRCLQEHLGERIATKIDRQSEQTLAVIKTSLRMNPVSRPAEEDASPRRLLARMKLLGYVTGIVLTLCVAAYSLGSYLARPTPGEIQAMEQWEQTLVGRQLMAWSRLNGDNLRNILECKFSQSTRVVHHSNLSICYPAGNGTGYYLPTP